ncbi:MAG: FkbM family methyltransferase, partial [Flavobacterium sp.]
MVNIPEPSLYSLGIIKNIWNTSFGQTISCIFEFGARYGEDSIAMSTLFPNSRIISFECNPNTLDQCRNNIYNKPRIRLIEAAIGNYDGKVKFYPINKERTITSWKDGNQGASSVFRSSGNYPIEQYFQDEIEVPIVTASKIIQELGIEEIDLLWMDIQGAELMALEGFKDKLA